jgi:hypothetical protein
MSDQGDIIRENTMRYFFDVKSKCSLEHDHTGQDLPSLRQAQELAELIATDLSCTRSDGLTYKEVQIRTSDGALIFSAPVKLVDAVAA